MYGTGVKNFCLLVLSSPAVLNAERDTNKQLVILLADKVADRISLTIVEGNL